MKMIEIYETIPSGTCIAPSNLYGENKYNKKVSQFCQFIGFTADIYNKSSRIIKLDKFLCIDMIAYKGISVEDTEEEKQKYYHKGHFANLIKKITEELNKPVIICNPMKRMRDISKKQGWTFVEETNSLLVFSDYINNNLFKVDKKV